MEDDHADTGYRPFLDHLDPPSRAELYQRSRRDDFAADQIISHQGDVGDTAMIVDAGLVKVTVSSASGTEVLLGLYGRGELLGETSALHGCRRSATVVGHLPGRMLHIPARAFRTFLTTQPALFGAVLATSASRLRHADHHRLSLAGHDVSARVAATLLSWAHQYGRRTDEGIEIGLRTSRRELAQSVVASEKTVDDVLTELRRAGVLRTGRRRFVVRDHAALARWATASRVS